jgi:hypothetical protein
MSSEVLTTASEKLWKVAGNATRDDVWRISQLAKSIPCQMIYSLSRARSSGMSLGRVPGTVTVKTDAYVQPPLGSGVGSWTSGGRVMVVVSGEFSNQYARLSIMLIELLTVTTEKLTKLLIESALIDTAGVKFTRKLMSRSSIRSSVTVLELFKIRKTKASAVMV